MRGGGSAGPATRSARGGPGCSGGEFSLATRPSFSRARSLRTRSDAPTSPTRCSRSRTRPARAAPRRIATWPAPPGCGGTPSPPTRWSPAPRACRHRDRRAGASTEGGVTATAAAPAARWELALAGWRLYAVVAACAFVIYLGALWDGFALDDRAIILQNPPVASPSGLWPALLDPYWRPEAGGHLYRPLAVVTYALDALVDGAPWFHFVNLLCHPAGSVAVAALARRLIGVAAGLAAGLIFAAPPGHVEGLAHVLGRPELVAGPVL